MKLSIIIPVYNEEKTILTVIDRVLSVNIPNIEKEIIVVDDGSSDLTVSKMRSYFKKGKNPNIKFVTHSKNQGKGAAVKTGIFHATGDYILIQDADLEYNPKDIPKLLSNIEFNKSQVVYGTRLRRLPNFRRDEKTFRFFIHFMGNRCLSLLTSILYGQWITDMETCYKIFPKKAVKDMVINAKRFDFEPEITARLLKKKYRILEVSISTNPRGYDEGKKLNTIKDGFIALWTLLKYRIVN